MATWKEIQQYARSKYKLARDEADGFSLVWAYPDGRSQLIIVGRFEAFKQEWVEFRSGFCKKGQLDPLEAVTRNTRFAVGGIALDGEVYMFRHSVPLANCQIEEFELPLHVVAATAEQLEREFAGGSDDF